MQSERVFRPPERLTNKMAGTTTKNYYLALMETAESELWLLDWQQLEQESAFDLTTQVSSTS